MHKHCWHRIPNSERKIKSPKARCQRQNLYVRNGHVVFQVKYECCICGKIRKHQRCDYDIDRALNYKPLGRDE